MCSDGGTLRKCSVDDTDIPQTSAVILHPAPPTQRGTAALPKFFWPMSMCGCRLSASNRQTQWSAFSAIAELLLQLDDRSRCWFGQSLSLLTSALAVSGGA